MLVMDVQASEVRLHWREPQEGDKLRYRQSQEVLMTSGPEGDAPVSHGVPSQALRHMMLSLAPPETFIAAVANCHVHETRIDPREHMLKGQDIVRQ